MELVVKFAKMMLEKKLDFLPLKEALELYDSGCEVNSRFWWVVRSEELKDNGDDMATEEILEIYGDSDYGITIGDKDYQFDEFTLALCSAPTYIDLLNYRD